MKNSFLTAVAVILLLTACKENLKDDKGYNSINLQSLETQIQKISSDEFEGRKPFTRGEKRVIYYLKQIFHITGLELPPGGYLQDVPMVEITPKADSVMQISSPTGKFTLKGFDDYTLTTERTDSIVSWKNEDVVFAGFGVVAPEYNWNDYEGLDVKGKIVLVLVNDPGFGGSDSTFFKGNTMTYYGRWTYKYEEAARQGAKGCFVIHNTVPAGYPFGVLQNSWNDPHLYLDIRGKKANYCQGIGWMTKDATEKLFSAAGKDFSQEQTKARQRGFKGYSLNTKISTSMTVSKRYDKSVNVIGQITGSKHPDEYVIYMAHWDHLGIGRPDQTGDSIYNGAYDNASGTAAIIELAKAFKSIGRKPERTVVFLLVTAEEQGLWGSAFYAQNPIYPIEKTVAVINIDGINPFGKMKDVMIVGKGQSEMEDILMDEAKKVDRIVKPEGDPEKGSFFRSDHFNFAKIGIPALYVKPGVDMVGKGPGEGQTFKDQYTQKYYHQPSDEFDTTRVNFEGAVDDLRLLYLVGKRLAFGEEWPKWKEGSEFKKARDEYLGVQKPK
jgi:Zn-dependent M28 family amino/carboxypeptidase